MSALDGIRERAAVVTSSEVFDLTSAFIQVAKSQEDLPRLLAAVEAVLAVCEDPGGPDSWSHTFQGRHGVFADDVRAAITSALEAKP